jgi:hypothetical protein
MPKKKKTATKKATYKRPAIRRRPIASGVGLISSIDCKRAMKDAFEAGSGVTNPQYKCNVGYKRLDDAVDAFCGDGTIGLIVTVGGLIAYQAANRWSTKPFISLAGTIPPDPGDQFRGSVNLQMYTFNPKRISYLGGKGFEPDQIYLFYNPNSATARDETEAWTGATPPIEGTTPGDNDAGTYPAAFDRITGQKAAVVISADPFFYDTKNKLIHAANRWVAASSTRYVCYPLQNYKNGGSAPTTGKATLYGPTLEQAYGYLGKLAAEVLSDPTGPVTIKQVPLGRPVDI